MNRTMYRFRLLQASLLVSGCVAAMCAAAGAPGRGQLGSLRAIELSVEATAGSLVIPSGANGSLLVTPCSGCAPLALQSDARSQYLLAEKPVAVATWRAAALAKPQSPVVVLYTKEGHRLTRVMAPTLHAAATPAVVGRP